MAKEIKLIHFSPEKSKMPDKHDKIRTNRKSSREETDRIFKSLSQKIQNKIMKKQGQRLYEENI